MQNATCFFTSLSLILLSGNSMLHAQAEPWVEWDPNTDHVVSHTDNAAAYPRAKRLSNGDIMLGYHYGTKMGTFGTYVTLRKSRDGGKSWYMTDDVERPEADFWGFSNVDFVELGGGRMILVTAARGKPEPGRPQFLSECERSELRIRFSDNYGATWGPPHGIARGRGRLWEPAFANLPNGDLAIYFANEAPDLSRNGQLQQRIEVTTSSDKGKTWNTPVEVSYHKGMRNGMPAVILLKNGRMACAQEIVGDNSSPWITQTRGTRNEKEEYVAQNSYGFGGAPFLLKAPDGTTLLSFHSSHSRPPAPEGTPDPWAFASFWILKGDAQAKNFAHATRPWPKMDPRTGSFFGSLMMKDLKTLVAMASFITQANDNTSRIEIRWIEGKLKGIPRKK